MTAEDVIARGGEFDDLVAWVMAQSKPAVVKAAQAKFGASEVAHAIEDMFAQLSRKLVAAGVTRLVVAGGETSGAAVVGIQAEKLRVGPRLAAGVPVLADDARTLAVALKSGNFGGEHFFAEALSRMKNDN